MSRRLIYSLGLLIVLGLLLASLYLQIYQGYLPCPLCTLQRFCFALLGLLFLFGIFFSKNALGRLTINLFAIMTSATGLFFAGRQIWLQFFEKNVSNNCPVSLSYMLKILPTSQILKKILEGSPDCAERGWIFLSLDLAEWSFLWFLFFFALSIFLLVNKKLR